MASTSGMECEEPLVPQYNSQVVTPPLQYTIKGMCSSNKTFEQGNSNDEDKTNLFAVIERLLRQEQESKSYQVRLEARISGDSAAYHRLRGHYIQMERMVSGFQQVKSQNEAALRWAGDACYSMARDLELERNKVRELETRLTELQPTIETVIRHLSGTGSSLSSQEIKRLWNDNQRQRDLILCLQATLHAREQTVLQLKTTLEEMFGGLLDCEDNHVSDGGTTLASSDDGSVDIITSKSA